MLSSRRLTVLARGVRLAQTRSAGSKLHPALYRQIADSWPHEETDPENYTDKHHHMEALNIPAINATIKTHNSLLLRIAAMTEEKDRTPTDPQVVDAVREWMSSRMKLRAMLGFDGRDADVDAMHAKIGGDEAKVMYVPEAVQDGTETTHGRAEDFSSSIYTQALLAVLVSALAYKLFSVYRNLYPDAMAWGEDDADDPYDDTRKWVAIAQKEADDQLILRELGRPPAISRIDNEGIFHRCSDRMIIPGADVDVSDIKHKKSWMSMPVHPNKVKKTEEEES